MNFFKKNNNKGFTIVELLIVSSIFVVITSVLLVRFSSFNSTIITTNLAYDVALSIRKAQSFGLNVRNFDSGNETVFDTGYGIHFESTSNTSYLFFADLNKNVKYSSNELVEVFNIGGGHTIKKFCAVISGSNQNCSDRGDIDDLDIVFIRPEPDAHIKSHEPDITYESAIITVVSSSGAEREIRVFSTGQISIVKK